MALPYRKTEDGFEMQIGTNHFGHFALTGLLMDHLLAAGPSRVVTVSSGVHVLGKVKLDDLQSERRYQRWLAYAQSKLCNLLFAYELDRRVRARGLPLRSLGCHPGYSSTNLQLGAARMAGSSFRQRIWRWINGLFAQSAEMGALPTLFAAAAEEAQGGDYIGPRLFKIWGHPVKQRSSGRSRDEAIAKRLWDVSEELTGVSFKETLGG
jgi:NAD(P)-dependent dehydrogenase (short-subunit alcohol dehydrogenase family)